MQIQILVHTRNYNANPNLLPIKLYKIMHDKIVNLIKIFINLTIIRFIDFPNIKHGKITNQLIEGKLKQ